MCIRFINKHPGLRRFSFAIVETLVFFVFFDLTKMFTSILNALCNFCLNKPKDLECSAGQNVQYFKFYFTSEEPEAPIIAPF